MSQIALPFAPRAAAGPVRVVVGNGNRAVVDGLARPDTWPFHTAILVGPRRSGKSLLAALCAQRGEGEVIDDADRHDEAALFHVWNRAQETGRSLLLTAQMGWQIVLPDLASRMGGSLHLALLPPGDAMIADLIAAHAEQRGLLLGEGAAAFIAGRIERSYAAVEEAVAMIDRLSLERQVPATMSVWRDALDAIQGPEQGRLL